MNDDESGRPDRVRYGELIEVAIGRGFVGGREKVTERFLDAGLNVMTDQL